MAKVIRPQPPMSSEAEAYSETAFKLSEGVLGRARAMLDITYGPHEDQALDLYLPDNEFTEPVPVLIFVHGGGWTHGYKEWMGFMAPAVTCLPAIFISIGYRLAPEFKHPEPADDCRSALKWVYENIANFRGDPNRIFIGGHSAGGHHSSLITLQRDALKAQGLPEDVIKGCFPVSGAVDMTGESRSHLFNSPEDARDASPIRHVSGNTVPFYLSIGENDLPHLKPQFEEMTSALKKEAGAVEAIEMKDWDHFQINIENGNVDGVWATTVRQWMANPPGPGR
jgi:arylformamidase